ncbi:MAG: thioredoxin-disulfide reductase [Thermotogae bacterium]|nr:thioredoxin-disulfide reductase [Thermotogota bacterium]RKX46572.1 MAG: thioredoxin-disulfide reductase [Thermotogota bacterium]
MVFFDVGSAKSELKNYYDVVVIGGGPAGLTAAIYARQSGLSVLVLEKDLEGGYMNLTESIENYPGFTSIRGEELGVKMVEHATHFGAHLYTDGAERIEVSKDEKLVHLESGKKVHAKVVIVAAGSKPKQLGVPGEGEFRARGVSYCATCDGHFFKDGHVVVVGGGNSAFDESLFLSKMVKKVTIVHILEKPTADARLREKVESNEKIEYRPLTELVRIEGDDRVKQVVLKNLRTNEEYTMEVDGVFIFVGMTPNSQILEGLAEFDQWGYVITDENMETKTAGIFAVGDIRSKNLRQIITAASDGAIAAFTAAHKYFE